MRKSKWPIRKIKRLHRSCGDVIVRPFRESDFSAYCRTLTMLLPKQNLLDVEECNPEYLKKSHFRRALKFNKSNERDIWFFHFGVFHKRTGDLVGQIALMDVSRGVFQNGYMGWRIYNRWWGKGYAKQAVACLIDIAFRDFDLHRVEAAIERWNSRSIAVADGLKMTKFGFSKKHLFLRDKWIDVLLFSLTAEEWGIRMKPKIMGRPVIRF